MTGRALLVALLVAGLVPMARAETLELIGQSGVLGEWELTSDVTATDGGRTKEFVGPLKMRHVGYCTQDGPEERMGEIRVRLSGPSASHLTATLLVNGVECSYSGQQSDGYTGSLRCPDRRAVPLILWLKPKGGS